MSDPLKKINDQLFTDTLERIRGMVGNQASSKELQDQIRGFGTQKGIYKPQGSDYPLWIRQTLGGNYPDEEPQTLPDGSWTYRYKPEASKGGTDMSIYTNRAMLKSMEDKIPIGVFIQENTPGSKHTYKVMGLAFVEDYREGYFTIHGEPIAVDEEPMVSSNIRPFQPYETGIAHLSQLMRETRRKAFQTAVRRIYHEKCSLCELGFTYHGESIGVEAAHVIPVSERGTSKDIRNGILLCENHHTLFDKYLWAFDEDFKVRVTEDRAFRDSAKSNHVLKVEGRKLPNLPDEEFDRPAMEAIRFRLDHFDR